MQIHQNKVKFSKEENAKIREIKNKHSDLQSYCTEIFEYLETIGLKFDISSVPLNPGVYKKYIDNFYTGWKGTIDIKCTNYKDISVSSILWGDWINTFKNEKIFEVETCTGGGTNPVFYQREFIILFKTLPKLKYKLLKEEFTEKLNNEFKIAVQDEIKSEQKKYNDTLRKNINDDFIHNEITSELSILEDRINQLKKELSKRTEIIKKQTSKETPMVLTDISDIPNTVLDKNSYNSVSSYKLKKQDSDVYRIAKKAHKFVQEHPELLVI